jgi:hypothetical protein
MAPGVAGALIATVVGLFVAIPAMFAYNYMVTTIRAITQELDNFTAEYATALEHKYVDNRSLVEELREILRPAGNGMSFAEPWQVSGGQGREEQKETWQVSDGKGREEESANDQYTGPTPPIIPAEFDEKVLS